MDNKKKNVKIIHINSHTDEKDFWSLGNAKADLAANLRRFKKTKNKIRYSVVYFNYFFFISQVVVFFFFYVSGKLIQYKTKNLNFKYCKFCAIEIEDDRIHFWKCESNLNELKTILTTNNTESNTKNENRLTEKIMWNFKCKKHEKFKRECLSRYLLYKYTRNEIANSEEFNEKYKTIEKYNNKESDTTIEINNIADAFHITHIISKQTKNIPTTINRWKLENLNPPKELGGFDDDGMESRSIYYTWRMENTTEVENTVKKHTMKENTPLRIVKEINKNINDYQHIVKFET